MRAGGPVGSVYEEAATVRLRSLQGNCGWSVTTFTEECVVSCPLSVAKDEYHQLQTQALSRVGSHFWVCP
jgi:hypothetical protein